MLQRFANASSHDPAASLTPGCVGWSLRNWLDARTGYRRGIRVLFGRELPDGPRWGLSVAACLLWLVVVQVVTGFLLMTTYSPSLSTAWASVHFIERDGAGAFLRGVHHFAAQAMIVLLAVHLIRVLLTATFRAPRELVWITGLLLIPLVLVWIITGNPLSGSQRGMAQIEVEGNIVGTTPLIGPILQRVLIGGDRVGNLTLTHLYFLHVALLPLLGACLLGVHLWQLYRHGLSGSPQFDQPPRRLPYWPHQTVRNMVILALVLGTVAVLAAINGARLEMPADPEFEHTPRPEWYFLALFELRRHFNGPWELVATVLIPLAVLSFLFCLPLIDSHCTRRISVAFRYGVVILCCSTWGWLTASSLARDRNDAEYRASEAQMDRLSARSREIADGRGIPVDGAVALLRNDSQTQGPRLFARHCQSCHSHSNADGKGLIAREPSAPNLYRFASREWIAGLLDPKQIDGANYFGRTKAAQGDMASFVHKTFDAAKTPEKRSALAGRLQTVAAALSAEAARNDEAVQNRRNRSSVVEGIRLMSAEFACTDCHRFHDKGELGSAPDLTGYGSREWLKGMISNPARERFYGKDRGDRMPAFLANSAEAGSNLLSPGELDLLVDWLRGEWYEPPTGGDSVRGDKNSLAHNASH